MSTVKGDNSFTIHVTKFLWKAFDYIIFHNSVCFYYLLYERNNLIKLQYETFDVFFLLLQIDVGLYLPAKTPICLLTNIFSTYDISSASLAGPISDRVVKPVALKQKL